MLTAKTNPGRRLQTAKSLWRSSEGISMIEFGLCLPLLAMIIFGGLEYINLVLAYQKIERIASTTADSIARNTLPPNEQTFVDTFAAVEHLAKPFDANGRGRLILTGVIGTNVNGSIVNKIVWQRCGGARTALQSRVGKEWTGSSNYADGPNITLPSGAALLQNQMVVLSEIEYEYEPVINLGKLGLGPSDGLIRQHSMFVTRGQAFPFITPFSGIEPARCNA